jgi:hypothetical protein
MLMQRPDKSTTSAPPWEWCWSKDASRMPCQAQNEKCKVNNTTVIYIFQYHLHFCGQRERNPVWVNAECKHLPLKHRHDGKWKMLLKIPTTILDMTQKLLLNL